MSNNKNTYTISLDYFTWNGVPCKDLEVKWQEHSCINIKCKYDPKTRSLKVTIPESCKGECLYVTVTCNDNLCVDCPSSKTIKICPCEFNSDCDDCETCIDNICVSTCDDYLFCEDSSCVECNDENPCPNNQVCNSGKCDCPKDKPYLNSKGFCIDCNDENPCPEGFICTEDGCKPKKCDIGYYDIKTDDCVECLNTGHCDDLEECIDNTCECIKGYERNLETRKCEPIDECQLDKDCPDCEVCVNGNCEPLVCPDGYICVPELGCVLECDCNNRDCENQGSSCVDHPNISGKCYCFNCGNNDCSESGGECGPDSDKDGCICSQDNSCDPDPCNGVICPENSTCVNGECIPLEGDCDNAVTLTKLPNCKIFGKLEKNCACPKVSSDIFFDIKRDAEQTGIILDIKADYKKGHSNGPLFTNISNTNIAHNENIEGGGIRVECVGFYESNGNVLSEVISKTLNKSQAFTTVNGGGTSTANTTGVTFTASEKYFKYKVEIYRENFYHHSTDCRYNEELINTFYINKLSNGSLDIESVQRRLKDNSYSLINNDIASKSLFTWLQDGVIIRQHYSSISDTISWENSGEEWGAQNPFNHLKPCTNVTLRPECLCNEESTDTDFCVPENVSITPLNNCKKSIQVNIPGTCSLHEEENTIYRITYDGVVLDIPSSTISVDEVLTKVDNTCIEEVKVEIVCENGRVVCEHVKNFANNNIDIPISAECTDNALTNVTYCGSITFPNVGFGSINIVTPGLEQLNVQGQTVTFCDLNTPSSISVEYKDGCCNDEEFIISIPLASSCFITPVNTDPCSCDTRVESPTGECFIDTIEWDITGFDRLIITGIQGVIKQSNGEALSISDLQSIIDNIDGDIKSLSVCVTGTYTIFANVESDNVVGTVSANITNTCLFNCCPTIIDFDFAQNVICDGTQAAIVINGLGAANVVFEIYDHTGQLVGTQTIAYDEVNGSSHLYPISLSKGEWTLIPVSLDSDCGRINDLEASVIVQGDDLYNVEEISCEVVSGGNRQFQIRITNNGVNVTNAVANISGVVNNGNGLYSGIVNNNTTIVFTIPASGVCPASNVTHVVNCDCDSVDIQVSGLEYCTGNNPTVSVLNSAGYNVNWIYNGNVISTNTNTVVNLIPNVNIIEVEYIDVTNSNCRFSQTFTFVNSGSIGLEINQSNVEYCTGDTVLLSTSVNVTGAVTYSWNIPSGTTAVGATGLNGSSILINTNGYTGLLPVSVTATFNGCTETVAIVISESQCCGTITNMFTNVQNIDCVNTNTADGSVTANPSGGVNPYTYSWTGPNGYANNTQIISNLSEPGVYQVTITDNNGCIVSDSVQILDLNNCPCDCDPSLFQYSNNCNNGIGLVSTSGLDCPTVYNITLNNITVFSGNVGQLWFGPIGGFNNGDQYVVEWGGCNPGSNIITVSCCDELIFSVNNNRDLNYINCVNQRHELSIDTNCGSSTCCQDDITYTTQFTLFVDRMSGGSREILDTASVTQTVNCSSTYPGVGYTNILQNGCSFAAGDRVDSEVVITVNVPSCYGYTGPTTFSTFLASHVLSATDISNMTCC